MSSSHSAFDAGIIGEGFGTLANPAGARPNISSSGSGTSASASLLMIASPPSTHSTCADGNREVGRDRPIIRRARRRRPGDQDADVVGAPLEEPASAAEA